LEEFHKNQEFSSLSPQGFRSPSGWDMITVPALTCCLQSLSGEVAKHYLHQPDESVSVALIGSVRPSAGASRSRKDLSKLTSVLAGSGAHCPSGRVTMELTEARGIGARFQNRSTHMNRTIFTAACAVALSLGLVGAADARGCIKGAIVGGIAGHLAGHGKLGAAAGCAIGHHEANKPDPNNANAQVPEKK
jgi:hypothetical protein